MVAHPHAGTRKHGQTGSVKQKGRLQAEGWAVTLARVRDGGEGTREGTAVWTHLLHVGLLGEGDPGDGVGRDA